MAETVEKVGDGPVVAVALGRSVKGRSAERGMRTEVLDRLANAVRKRVRDDAVLLVLGDAE